MTDQQEPNSFILIRFTDIGSAMFAMDTNGVTPMQMLMIGDYLSLRGRNELIKLENKRIEEQERNRIEVPGLLKPE